MVLTGGYPFPLIKNGLPFNYPALEKSIHTDVLVIGGGVSGALVGYLLNKAGVDCVIIDGRTIGLGSTCASTSLLQYEIDTALHLLVKKVGLQNAVTAYQLCEEAVIQLGKLHEEVNCDSYVKKKSLYFAAAAKHKSFLQKEFDIRKANGFNVQLLFEKEVAGLTGFRAAAAILSATAAQTDAYLFTHALHQHAIANGLRVFDRSMATEIIYRRNQVRVKTANGAGISARKIVFANGYEAAVHLPKKTVSLHNTYALVSEQNTAAVKYRNDELLLWNTADPYLYLRSTTDRRIMIGGRDEPYHRNNNQLSMVEKKAVMLQKDFAKLFPQITFRPEFAWSGVFVTTEDGLPFIGEMPGNPNAFFSLGYGGNGITFSLVGAQIITDLLTKGHSVHRRLFSFNRTGSVIIK